MIQNLILSIGLSFAVGLSGAKDNSKNSINKDTPFNVAYNDADYEITLNSNELNNYTYHNLKTLLNSNSVILTSTTFLYDSATFDFDSIEVNSQFSYASSDFVINFYLDGDDNFVLYNSDLDENTTFNSNAVWTLNTTIYDDVKNAIELDIQANQQQPATSMGNSIINAIKSGLGLIGNLASEFLNGFSKLFWQNNSLTTFGTFALVFLGVAITMAVVSLVLKLIRGNTGA